MLDIDIDVVRGADSVIGSSPRSSDTRVSRKVACMTSWRRNKSDFSRWLPSMSVAPSELSLMLSVLRALVHSEPGNWMLQVSMGMVKERRLLQ